MKVMRYAPIIGALALLAGSSAFAQNVKFSYGVSGGCMTNSAVIAAPACGSAVLTQPAVVSGCNSCDPYLPLWQQSVIDAKGCWGQRVSGLPSVLEATPACAMTQAAVIDTGCGATLTQPAVLDSCGTVLQQSAIAAPAAANVITQPMYIQGTNPYDINLFSGAAQCAPVVQEQPAVVQPQEQPQLMEKTTIHTVKTTRITTQKRVMVKHHKHFRKICRHKAQRILK
ncbi:MAG TPA: hypothetical protein V6D22_23400 [Candidatus Obscuribacterales bacterium]